MKVFMTGGNGFVGSFLSRWAIMPSGVKRA